MSIRMCLLMLLFWIGVMAPAEAQQSSCADCHIANPQADPAPDHLSDWERSAHGRNNVGCETCHKGNAATFESFLAHQGILTSGNPSSPVHRSNLPRTCGACHTGPFVAFQKSRHFALLSEGSDEVPSCSTCHGSVAAELLSPRRLEKQCESCHGQEGELPRPQAPISARVLMEEAANIRAMLRQASDLIGRIEDASRRRDLEAAYEQAQVPLTEAVQSAHAFVFDNMRDRLDAARERAATLLTELANP